MRKYRKFWIDDSDEGDTRIFLDNIRTELWSIDDAKDEIDCWWVANDPQRLLSPKKKKSKTQKPEQPEPKTRRISLEDPEE